MCDESRVTGDLENTILTIVSTPISVLSYSAKNGSVPREIIMGEGSKQPLLC